MKYFSILILCYGVSHAQLAFPTAQGPNVAGITGGRGGTVYHCNTLVPDAPLVGFSGGARAIIEASGARIMVFDVYGTIDWSTSSNGRVTISSGNLTIAGQTAGGVGSLLNGITFKNVVLRNSAKNVIIRNIRFRHGDLANSTPGAGRDAFQDQNTDTTGSTAGLILDHCSFSWGIDECSSIGGPSKNVTLQYSYFTEGLFCTPWRNCDADCPGHYKTTPPQPQNLCIDSAANVCDNLPGTEHDGQCPHSKGFMFHNTGAGPYTGHHNILAHNKDRNPQLVTPGDIEWVNNVVYDYGNTGGNVATGVFAHAIGNRWIVGVGTPLSTKGLTNTNNPVGGTPPRNMSIYALGNIGPGRPTDNGFVSWANEWTIANFANTYQSQVTLFTPTVTAEDVNTVWADGDGNGFSDQLDEAGCLPHDDVDTRIESDITLGNGGTLVGNIISSQDEVGGWPDLGTGATPETFALGTGDYDRDGMPDTWETARGLDPLTPASPLTDANGNGYPDIEDYINGLLDGTQFAIPTAHGTVLIRRNN